MESDKETNPIPEIQRSAIVMGCPTIFPAGSVCVCGQVVETSSSSPANRHTPLCPRLFISPGVRGVDNTPHKLPMATRDIYETGFDEDVQTNSSTQTHVRSVMAGSLLPTRSKRSVRTVDSLLTNNESITVLNGELTIRTSESGRALH